MTQHQLLAPLRSFGIEKSVVTEIAGRAHQTWKIESADGVFILKQYANTDLESLQQSIEFQKRLITQYIPIPLFNITSSGSPITKYEEKLYVLSRHVDHVPLSAPAIEISVLKQAATTLGSLHKLDRSIYQDLLKEIDFSKTTKAVTELIPQFSKKYSLLISTYPNQRHKLTHLRTIITTTESLRHQHHDLHFPPPWECIHGDYTPDNVLIERSSNTLFIIDWDNAKIAPRAFEIHKAIGAFCGRAPRNAYLVPIDWEKADVFLRAYHAVNPLTIQTVNEIVTSAAYGSSTYWLRFTLLQTLAEDFRMLDLLPENIEDCVFWKNNLDTYRRLLLSILSA
ncbi:MAG: phosphotransferase [Candidatus Gottesmanbacteria bacterium]|nr:phosphotransferase [Candidatus Gottesmanbacteria bacterium]